MFRDRGAAALAVATDWLCSVVAWTGIGSEVEEAESGVAGFASMVEGAASVAELCSVLAGDSAVLAVAATVLTVD